MQIKELLNTVSANCTVVVLNITYIPEFTCHIETHVHNNFDHIKPLFIMDCRETQ